jgi:hypothetical protein
MSDTSATIDIYNAIPLSPSNGSDNLNDWKVLNAQWVDEEKKLIETMIENSNKRYDERKQYYQGSDSPTPYVNFSEESEVIINYKYRRVSRINKQLHSFNYNNEEDEQKKQTLLEHTYPTLNIDNLPTWRKSDIKRGGKSRKSKKSNKSKKSKKSNNSKKARKSKK